MELLDRLKVRLQITGEDENALLEEMLTSATEIFLSLRYPVTSYPVDADGKPVIDPRWNGWIVSAAVELDNKMGVEGQTGHNENGINRSYESADLSHSLCQKITPEVGIVRATR